MTQYYKDSHYPQAFIDGLKALCWEHNISLKDIFLMSYRRGEVRFNLEGGSEGAGGLHDARCKSFFGPVRFDIVGDRVTTTGDLQAPYKKTVSHPEFRDIPIESEVEGARVVCVREDATLWKRGRHHLWVDRIPLREVPEDTPVYCFFSSWGQLYIPAKFVKEERPGLLAFGPEGPSYAFLNERMAVKGYFPQEDVETTEEGWDCISLANVAKSENPAIRSWLRDLGLA